MIKTNKKQITVDEYETSDGQTFTDKVKAEEHEAIITGKAKQCSKCNGSGRVPNEDYRQYYACNKCNGKGILYKKVVWE